MNRSTADRLFWLFFTLLSLFNLLVIRFSPLNLSPDEAHYWDWSRHLDWSYYSKGPLVAYLIAGSRLVFGDTEFGVRFPAFFCYAIFSAAFYYFLRRFFMPLYALLGWLALRSMLIFAQTGVVMTTDAPAALFWFLALASAYLAVIEERRTFWIYFGLSIGIGIAAKYTLLFLFFSTIAYLLIHPQLRNHLRSREFFIGLALMLVAISPIVYWNSQHDWVNFAHNSGHLIRDRGFAITLAYLVELIIGQAGLAGPIVFVGLCYAMVRGYQSWRRGDIAAGLLLFSCAPLAAFVVGISLTKRIYANWPLPLYIGALALFVHLLTQHRISWTKNKRIIRWGLILSGAMTVAAHLPVLGYTLGVPGKILPTKKLAGWSDLGAIVNKQVVLLSHDGQMPFITSDDYEDLSTLTFYGDPRSDYYCARLDNRRMNQYDIWGGWDRLQGRSGIVVLRSKDKIERLRPHFTSITPIEPQPTLHVEYSSTPLRDFYLFYAQGYDGSAPEYPTNF